MSVVRGLMSPEAETGPPQEKKSRAPAEDKGAGLRSGSTDQNGHEGDCEATRGGEESRDQTSGEVHPLPPFFDRPSIPLPRGPFLPGLRSRAKRRKVGEAVPCGSHRQKQGLSECSGFWTQLIQWTRRVCVCNQARRDGHEHDQREKAVEMVVEESLRGPVKQLEDRGIRIGQEDIGRGQGEQACAAYCPKPESGRSAGHVGPLNQQQSGPTQDSEKQQIREPL